MVINHPVTGKNDAYPWRYVIEKLWILGQWWRKLQGDIVIFIAEGYTFDHGDGLPTVRGVKNTSVAPIFFAAGKGLKQGEIVSRIIR